MSTAAWASWVLLVMGVALTTTNPLYLAVVLLSVVLVGVLAPRTATAVAGFRALLLLGVSLFAISFLVAVINGSAGTHVLFTMPGPNTPSWLGGLQVGGPVTAEGLVAASIRGMAILTVLLAFAVFNGAVSPHQVLRTSPAALFHAGLVVTVGLALLPATIEDVRRLREIQALRGHSTGLRSLPGLVVPAVLGGLERSMRLAEAMEARGYASSPPAPLQARLAGMAAAPLLLAAAWCWYYDSGLRPLGAFLAAAGVGALAAWFASAARARKTTRFRTEPTHIADRTAAALSAFGGVGVVVAAAAGWRGLAYNPFAALPAPEFGIAGALLALACAWPALRLALAPQRHAPPGVVEPEPAFSRSEAGPA
jgi:energy-coupling factor transport system permease protein